RQPPKERRSSDTRAPSDAEASPRKASESRTPEQLDDGPPDPLSSPRIGRLDKNGRRNSAVERREAPALPLSAGSRLRSSSVSGGKREVPLGWTELHLAAEMGITATIEAKLADPAMRKAV
ncbi:unnamed protein product, partial [Phaeothamnion confervicola]